MRSVAVNAMLALLPLVHGDCHSGNVYFEEGEGQAESETAGFFDFQVASAEQPMRDVTYFLFYAASVPTLAAHEASVKLPACPARVASHGPPCLLR